ncbi:unnamed protein product [Symbiodinium pilosum]|uniref:Uncharacterized protein n=1 Tax=Symbiodinium pilosum TaxID=2952 RepID=A0A812SHW6_SYMPI|nr:unnamed protein product [Symbiodinium pilosum]
MGAARRNYMRVDARVQAKLALLPPQERVQAVAAALEGRLDEEESEEEDPVEDDGVEIGGGLTNERGPQKEATDKVLLLGKDAQELRVVQAFTQIDDSAN